MPNNAASLFVEIPVANLFVDLGNVVTVGTKATTEGYTGDYEITPTFAAQTLETKGKTLSDNITANAIPVSSVSNEAGGRTIIIGG